MSPSNATLLTNRTAIETDWLCGMKYWWYQKEAGTGIVPSKEADYFLEGRLLHDGLAQIATGTPWQDVLPPRPETLDQMVLENWARRAGWLTAFGKWIWPSWSRDYEVVCAEKEMILDRSPLWVAFTADLVLRCVNKQLDFYPQLVVKEFKTTSLKSPSWVAHWDAAVQVHIQLAGVEEELGEKVAFGHVVGLDKGYESKGRLHHPYVWAYEHNGAWQPGYKWGWTHRPVWEYNAPIPDWVDECGEDLGRAQFINSAPIFLDRRLLESMIRRRIEREAQIRDWTEASQRDWTVREQHFEQRFSQCRPAMGKECAYYAACKNLTVQEDPLGSGLYQVRIPHHDIELIGEE